MVSTEDAYHKTQTEVTVHGMKTYYISNKDKIQVNIYSKDHVHHILER